MISARLKVRRTGQRKPGGLQETVNTFMSVISAYAPIAKAPPGVKQKFFEDLQHTVDKISPSDVLLILGNFNACVGSIAAGDDLQRSIRDRHGIGNCNIAGERLLEFCAVNSFTIMNTSFSKKEKHIVTWKNPATKQEHMINYVLLRSVQCPLCLDVQVMRGDTC